MTLLTRWYGVLIGALLCLPVGAYEFPIDNGLLATVVGTPTEAQADLPEIPRRPPLSLTVKPRETIPDVFWYHRTLDFTFLPQNKKAPLIFIIAGTGGDHRGGRMDILHKIFYQAGFHVIALPSPTHASFVVAASSSSVPGDAESDAADLYAVMKLAYEKVASRIEVTDFFLTGYSLGGFNSAFISKLDEQERAFNFKKVLVICPPVNLYTSVSILDRMRDDNVAADAASSHEWIETLISKFGQVYEENQEVELGGDFLYLAYQRFQPDQESIEGLIGSAFRLSSANMSFASDVMTESGFVVRKGTRLTPRTSLMRYAMASFRTSFADYLDGIMLPHFQKQEPDLTRDALIERTSLRAIEDYLASADKIGMMTNADEIILGPGELDYLKRLFGDRATIYPRGGHCGNMDFPDNVADTIEFFGG